MHIYICVRLQDVSAPPYPPQWYGSRMCRPPQPPLPMVWVQALQDETLTMLTRSPASLLIKLLMSISCNASEDMQTGTAALRSAANRSAYRSKHLQIAINYEYQPHAHGDVKQLLIWRLGLLHTTTTGAAGGTCARSEALS